MIHSTGILPPPAERSYSGAFLVIFFYFSKTVSDNFFRFWYGFLRKVPMYCKNMDLV